MADPVAELEYLSRSKHRIQVLRELREPCDRVTLRERTGASKPTLSRVLGDFEERAWVTRTNGHYRLTALGELLETGLDETVRALETVEKLAPLSAWLPTDRFGFDLDRLNDATVHHPSPTEALGVHSRLGSVLYGADRVRVLTGTVASGGIDLHRRAIEDHGQTLEVILTADALAAIRSSAEMAQSAAAVLASDGVSVFRYDEPVPYFLALVDDSTLIGVTDETGTIRGLIESSDPAVRTWTSETLEEYRVAATEVDDIEQ